jgi:hypothetical protein
MAVDRLLNIGQELGCPLHLVQYDATRIAGEKPSRISERELANIWRFEGDEGLGGKRLAAQGRLSGLPGPGQRQHGVATEQTNDVGPQNPPDHTTG